MQNLLLCVMPSKAQSLTIHSLADTISYPRTTFVIGARCFPEHRSSAFSACRHLPLKCCARSIRTIHITDKKKTMPDYKGKFETIAVGGTDYHIRSLLDLQPYSDPDGAAEHAGISPASWPLFGHIWPSARVLALAMDDFSLADKRILDIGAGAGLASRGVHRRAGDVTMSDCHPLSQVFLLENLLLNGLGPSPYQDGNWNNWRARQGPPAVFSASALIRHYRTNTCAPRPTSPQMAVFFSTLSD